MNMQVVYSSQISIPIPRNNEEINYGKQVVSKIKQVGNVILNETTVTGEVFITGNITSTNVNFASTISVSGNATLNSSVCQRELSADGNIIATKTCAKAPFFTIRDINVYQCSELEGITAEGDVDAEDCPSIKSICAGNYIGLRQSIVKESVTSKKSVNIQNSKIGGTLTCLSNHLIIEGSQIETINLRYLSGLSKLSDGMRLSLLTGGGEENQKESREQVLVLKNCIIKDIIFEGGEGRALLTKDSSIKGEVIGGVVEYVI
jgi:hypothetical protein